MCTSASEDKCGEIFASLVMSDPVQWIPNTPLGGWVFMEVFHSITWSNHKGGTVTGGYGFGYVSDMYPNSPSEVRRKISEEPLCPNLSDHNSLFSMHVLFLRFFYISSRAGFLSATRTPRLTQSPLCSLFAVIVHSKWFTNHSNHNHIFTPITRVVATLYPIPIMSDLTWPMTSVPRRHARGSPSQGNQSFRASPRSSATADLLFFQQLSSAVCFKHHLFCLPILASDTSTIVVAQG